MKKDLTQNASKHQFDEQEKTANKKFKKMLPILEPKEYATYEFLERTTKGSKITTRLTVFVKACYQDWKFLYVELNPEL